MPQSLWWPWRNKATGGDHFHVPGVSWLFQGEAQVFRAELHMGPKSKQKCSEREAGTPGQSLEDRGGSLVSRLAQPAKEQAS